MKKILMLTISLCMVNSAFAMNVSTGNDKILLSAAIRVGNLEKVKKIIENGTSIDARLYPTNGTPLIVAIESMYESVLILALESRGEFKREYDSKIVKFLLENGANVRAADDRGYTPLMLAAKHDFQSVIIMLLSQIPLSERKKIKDNVIAALRVFGGKPGMNRDTKKLIINDMISKFVNEHMERIKALLVAQDQNGFTARDMALDIRGLRSEHPEIAQQTAQLLDLTNPQSQKIIRAAVEKNIRSIISGS